MQGGSKPARNYLGAQKTVSGIPVKWKSGPDAPATELAYITKAEKDLLLKKDLHGSLKNGPNTGPDNIMSLDSQGDYTRDRSTGAYSSGPAGGGGGNTQQDLRNRAMNEKHMREILTGQKNIGQTTKTGPKTRKYAVPEYVKVKQKDGTYKDKYIGSGYKSYGTPSFFGNLFSRGAPGYRGIKGMPAFRGKPGFEARGVPGQAGFGYYSDKENFGDTRDATPFGIMGLLSKLFSKKKSRDFGEDNRKGLYEDRFKEDFNRNRKIPGPGESEWKGGMFNPETLGPTGAIGPEYGVEYDVNTEPYQLPSASDDSWEWTDNPITDFLNKWQIPIKSGGEKFYDLTQPGNPDPWQLAKEIGPIYRDKLPSLFANPSELERDFPGSVPNLKEPNPLLDRLNESLGDGQYNQSEVLRKSKNPSINYEGLYEDPHRFLKTADKFDRTGQSDNWWSGEIPVNARARADNRAYNRDRPLPSPYGERSYYFDDFNPRVGTPELTAEEQLDMGLLPDPFGGYGFKDGGRVRFANGGLASLFTRRG